MRLIVNAAPHLNVRSGPGGQYREVAELPDGTAVEVLERAPSGEPWAYVEPGRGWVSTKFLVAPAPTPAHAGWRTARSLLQLRDQVDRMAPHRSKEYDGTIGDQAHAARVSDHNPNSAGVVTAMDITHDPAHGCDCGALVQAMLRSKDPRIKYLIFRGKIVSSKVSPWVWRAYNGANAHSAHLHISVDPDPALYDDARPWRI